MNRQTRTRTWPDEDADADEYEDAPLTLRTRAGIVVLLLGSGFVVVGMLLNLFGLPFAITLAVVLTLFEIFAFTPRPPEPGDDEVIRTPRGAYRGARSRDARAAPRAPNRHQGGARGTAFARPSNSAIGRPSPPRTPSTLPSQMQFWVCDLVLECGFRSVSQLKAVQHVERTGHTVRRGTRYIRPRRKAATHFEPDPDDPASGRRLIVAAVVVSLLLATSPLWFPWVQAQLFKVTDPRPQTPSDCAPAVVTIQQVLGPEYPNESLNGSMWKTNSFEGGIDNKRALRQPCVITNVRGDTVGTHVRVKGLKLIGYGAATYDCRTRYDPVNGGGSYPLGQVFCDYVGNVYDAAYSGNLSKGFIHFEIDHDWIAAGFCGPGTACDNLELGRYKSNSTAVVALLDMTGYVYWDDDHWELHPLTAWSLSD